MFARSYPEHISILRMQGKADGLITYSTISRTILARLLLSSLYLRSSPLPEPVLSVVATLLVWVVVPLRIPIIASEERRCALDSGLDPYVDKTASARPVSTTVGLRLR